MFSLIVHSVLSARPLPWCRTPAPSGFVDGRPPYRLSSDSSLFCFSISPSFARSLSPCLSAKLHDCLFHANLFLFMNASRGRLFAYFFINLQTVRTRNPFGGIQPGARPSAHDCSGPRSRSSAFVEATLLFDYSGPFRSSLCIQGFNRNILGRHWIRPDNRCLAVSSLAHVRPFWRTTCPALGLVVFGALVRGQCGVRTPIRSLHQR